MVDLTNSYSYRRKYDLAVPLYQKLMEAYEVRLNHSGPLDSKSELNLVWSMNNLASALQLSGSPKEAVPLLERALRILQTVPSNRMDPKDKNLWIAYTEINFGWVLLRQHHPEAEKYIQLSQKSPISDQSNTWPHFAAKSLLAGISLGRKNGGESVKELAKGYDNMIVKLPIDIPPLEMACLDDTAAWLFEFYSSKNLPSKANKWRPPVKHQFSQ